MIVGREQAAAQGLSRLERLYVRIFLSQGESWTQDVGKVFLHLRQRACFPGPWSLVPTHRRNL
jgi:hypothetical protein